MKDSAGEEEPVPKVVKFSRSESMQHLKEAESLTAAAVVAVHKAVAHLLKERYVTMTQARIITQLFFRGKNATLKGLKRYTELSQPAISKYTRDLEEKGVITRNTEDNVSYTASLNPPNEIAKALIDKYVVAVFAEIVRLLQREIDRINRHIDLKGPFAEDAEKLLRETIDDLLAKQKEIAAIVLWAEKLKTIAIGPPGAVQQTDIERIVQTM